MTIKNLTKILYALLVVYKKTDALDIFNKLIKHITL